MRKSDCLLVFLLLYLVSTPMLYASDYNAKFSQLYRSKNYSEALNYAHHLSSRHPEDMTMRYYYADCLMKVGRVEQARKEFLVVTKYSGDKELLSLSKQALKSLGKETESQNKDTFDRKRAIEIRAKRERYMEQAEAEKQAVMRLFDSKIESIQNSSLPEGQKENRLEQVYEELKRKTSEITLRYQKKADELLSRKNSFAGGDSASGMRVVPDLSGRNVQNYENLGDQSDIEFIPENPPLRAKAKQLKSKPPSSSKKGNGKVKNDKK